MHVKSLKKKYLHLRIVPRIKTVIKNLSGSINERQVLADFCPLNHPSANARCSPVNGHRITAWLTVKDRPISAVQYPTKTDAQRSQLINAAQNDT